MSTQAAAITTVILLAFALVALIWQTRRALRSASERVELILGSRHGQWHYDGPDSLRLLEDLDAHLDSYEAAVAELYEPVTPVFPPARQHPGLALLRAAVLDEQQKGERA